MNNTQTFVFFGIMGSGKGTQVNLLIDYLKNNDSRECLYAGTGEEFRKIVGSGNYTANRIKDFMLEGKLVPDFLTTSIFTNVFISSLNKEAHLITDGYPRNINQSEIFNELMKFFERKNVKIIHIKISENQAMKRNLLRGRDDDTKEGIQKRIEVYNQEVIPAINYFKDKEAYEICTINGEQTIEEVHDEIIKKLNL